MDLQEHLDENPRLKAWYESVAAEEQALAEKGYHLVCGWPDEEHGYGWDTYINECISKLEELEEGNNAGSFEPFYVWQAWKRLENPERDNLGFSHLDCDLCGALPGDRYAVTALPDNPAENKDYLTYSVCGDCLQFIANGDLPGDL